MDYPTDQILYYERQSIHRLAFGLAISLGIIGLLLLLPNPNADPSVSPLRGIPGFLAVLTSVLSMNFLTMTIRLTNDELKIEYGRLLPYYRAHLPIPNIRQIHQHTPDPTLPRSWGIHHETLQDTRTRCFSLKTTQGILITLPQTNWYISTAHPQKLAEALTKATTGKDANREA